jgi:TolA-binding protein
MSRSVLTVWLVVFGVTPAFGQSAADRQLAADIRMLEQRTERIEAAISAVSEVVQGLSKQLAEQANISRKLSADGTVRLDEALAAVRVLREQLAETNQRLAAVLEQSSAPAGALELFNNARGDYTTGNYPLAVKGFTAFLSASPKASNAALAQYYLGEALRLDGRFDQALVAYDRLIVAYPASEEVPNARLRRAEVLNQLGRVAEAKAGYEIVIKESSNSEAAVVAKQRLTALGR